ncbi:Flavonoid 3'-monooxygenase [Abeliophyllum distichum]|uniref:Flavonoid 3'-monooxygenase n=1 Tax=Abeliophyllum distichum TaxID=126358 RepID=A0ABD1VAP1_9LAMI
MSEFVKHPKLMAKTTQELNIVIGIEKWVEESDIQNLSYLDAIVKKPMRLHPISVLLAPHISLEDYSFHKYLEHWEVWGTAGKTTSVSSREVFGTGNGCERAEF